MYIDEKRASKREKKETVRFGNQAIIGLILTASNRTLEELKYVIYRSRFVISYFKSHLRGIEIYLKCHEQVSQFIFKSHLRGIEIMNIQIIFLTDINFKSHLRGIEITFFYLEKKDLVSFKSHLRGIEIDRRRRNATTRVVFKSHLRGIEMLRHWFESLEQSKLQIAP